MVDPFNLLDTYLNAYGKRKKSSKKKDAQGEGTFEPQKKKKKVEMFLDEYGMPLSERQKAMILNETSGVFQESSKASDAPIHGKSPMAITLFISDSNIFGNVLPTSPFHSILSSPITPSSQSVLAPQS